MENQTRISCQNAGDALNGRFAFLNKAHWASNVYLFPFLEYSDPFDAMEVGDLDVRDAFGRPSFNLLPEVRENDYPVFRCPSDPAPLLNDRRTFRITDGGATLTPRQVDGANLPTGNADVKFPTNSYAAAHHDNNSAYGFTGPFCGAFYGMFAFGSRIRIRDVTDGTSNTILFGEKAYGRQLDPNNASVIVGGSNVIAISATSNGNDAFNHGFLSARPGINFNGPCDNRVRHGLHSVHPGGALVVLVDGSVRFLSENTQLVDNNPHNPPNSVLEYLFSRSDGFVVGEF